jgi:serine/threonine protein kinase
MKNLDQYPDPNKEDFYKLYQKYRKQYLNLKIKIKRIVDINLYGKRIDNHDSIQKYNFFNKEDCDIIFKGMDKGTIGKNKEFVYFVKGGQGSVYFLFIVSDDDEKYDVALKFVKLPRYLLGKNEYNYHHKKWREIFALTKCTEFVKNKVTQNLPIMYHQQLCKKNDDDAWLTIYSELADGNLIQWLNDKHSVSEWKSLFFQIWHAVDVLQQKLKLVHNDLRLPNILFYKNNGNDVYRYVIGDNKYYLDKPQYIFLIWDFGSSDTLLYPGKHHDLIKHKLDANKDLHFFHDMYNRLRVFAIQNRYTVEDLEYVLSKNEEDRLYAEKTKEENMKRFTDGRFSMKYKISLVYRIIETNKFDKLYMDRKETPLEGYSKIYLPPVEIDHILKDLSNNYNCSYEEALDRESTTCTKIPDPRELIETFTPEFKEMKEFSVSFYS